MKALGKVIVALLAIIGMFAVVAMVAGLWWLRTAGESVGGASSAAPPSAAQGATPGAGGSERIVAQRLTADVLVPFARLDQLIGRGVQTSAGEGGQLRVEADVDAMGRRVRAVALGELVPEGPRGTQVAFQPSSVEVPGAGALSGLLSGPAREAVTVRFSPSDVPEGLQIDRLSVSDDGVVAHVSGQRIPLR